MPRHSFVKQHAPSDQVQEIELDVTPIMSMFLILLPFLVSMAVLTHISMLQFSLPPDVNTVGAQNSAEKPKPKLTVTIHPTFLSIVEGENLLDSIPLIPTGYNFEALKTQLVLRKQNASVQDEIIVAVRDSIPMKTVVSVMDECRSAGFSKTGLSSAAGDARSAQ